MTRERFANRWLILLALLSSVAAACGNDNAAESGPVVNAEEETIRLQAELEAGATLNAATASSVRPVRPLLKCVDKLSSTSYRAHFSYVNGSSQSISIPIGFYNRFYPNPTNRGQGTIFATGTHADVIQVTFSSSSLAAWILGSGVALATRTSTLCPTGMGGATGAGGAGAGGKGGTAGTGAGGVGSGGSGAGGAAQCPSSCDDRNPCTTDICNSSTAFKCSNVAARDGTACEDGNACTNLDQCLAGVCTAGPAKVCVALDQCHVPGICDVTNGACTNPTATDGVSCSDGNGCTLSDTCRTGVCTGGSPKTCTASDQCHVAGACLPATGLCSNPNLTDGTPCSDASLCTAIDLCQAGVCVGTAPRICTALDQCHLAGVCAPATGLCPNPVSADGTTCNDGNVCTTGDACRAGVCTPAVTLSASHCAGTGCDQCSFDVGTDLCMNTADGCDNCIPSSAGCDFIADATDRQLCEDAYACFTDPVKNCANQGDVLTCWCGTNIGTCDTDNTGPTMANGPCLDIVTRAAKLTAATYDALTIELRLSDPDFPLGRAANLTSCRGSFCSSECNVH